MSDADCTPGREPRSVAASSLLPPPRSICLRPCLSVCLSVTNFSQKLPKGFAWIFLGRLAMGQWTNVNGFRVLASLFSRFDHSIQQRAPRTFGWAHHVVWQWRTSSGGAVAFLWLIIFITSAKEDMFSSLFVCLSVCLLATLRRNFPTDLHEIFREGWQWVTEQKIKFCWRSGFVTVGRYGKWYKPTALWDAAVQGMH